MNSIHIPRTLHGVRLAFTVLTVVQLDVHKDKTRAVTFGVKMCFSFVSILLHLPERGNKGELYPYPPCNAWSKIDCCNIVAKSVESRNGVPHVKFLIFKNDADLSSVLGKPCWYHLCGESKMANLTP